MSELAHESTHSVEEVDTERPVPAHMPPGSAVARFASGMGNQAFGSMVGGLTPAPRAAVARNGPQLGGSLGGSISNRGAKINPEFNYGPKEWSAGPITVGVTGAVTGELELTVGKDDPAWYIGGKKAAGGSGGGQETEVTNIWDDPKNKAIAEQKKQDAQKKVRTIADTKLEDAFKITEATVVMGSELGAKDKETAKQEAGVQVGVKIKTVANVDYLLKVVIFTVGSDKKDGKVTGWSGPKLGGEADIPIISGEENLDIGQGVKVAGKATFKPSMEIKPNWSLIWQGIADLGVAGAVELAATLGVIFAPAMAVYASFSMMHDEEALMGSIFNDARNIKASTSALAHILSGADPQVHLDWNKDNPRAKGTLQQAAAQIEQLLAARKIDRKTFANEMHDKKAYTQIYNDAFKAAEDKYRSEVHAKIRQWWEAHDFYDDSEEGKKKSWYERIRIGNAVTFFKEEHQLHDEADKRMAMAFAHQSGLGSLPASGEIKPPS